MNASLASKLDGIFASKIGGQFAPISGGQFIRFLQENRTEYKKFEFTMGKSSVEHYYPQNPLDESVRIPGEFLHNFGNLCLVSRSKNSELGRYMPMGKKDHYRSGEHDSLKQKLMMSKDSWSEKEIIEHGNEMKALLKKGSKFNLITMPSKTKEQALESTIEKRLSGICQEELKAQNISINTVNERTELYRAGNGYYIGVPEDFNAKYAIDERRFWDFLQSTQKDELTKL